MNLHDTHEYNTLIKNVKFMLSHENPTARVTVLSVFSPFLEITTMITL